MMGAGINRLDGPLKVTGRAKYSYERQEAGQPLYGLIRGAAIGKGRIASIDTTEAESSPGVVLVLTHLNRLRRDRSSTSPPSIHVDLIHFPLFEDFAARTVTAARST
jgi:CO/xanthine dehydrogenase Mo-binding subunit